jgi:hypothetical protein
MIPSPNLSDYIRRKVESAEKASKSEDLKASKELWLSELDNLFQTIESILDDPTIKGFILIEKSEKTLNEELVGAYSAPSMRITIGNDDVELSPVGMRILAARGRVDMKGPRGSVMLLLLKKDARPAIKTSLSIEDKTHNKAAPTPYEQHDYEWVVARKEIRSKEWPVLNQDSFLDALKVVLGDVASNADE